VLARMRGHLRDVAFETIEIDHQSRRLEQSRPSSRPIRSSFRPCAVMFASRCWRGRHDRPRSHPSFRRRPCRRQPPDETGRRQIRHAPADRRVSAVLVAPFLFFVPLPHGLAVWLLFGTAAVHALYELLLVKSYESAAFSAVYPVARGTGPLFTAIGAISSCTSTRRSRRSPASRWCAAGVIAMGLSHRATPRRAAGLAFALATGLTIGCYTLIDATGVRAVARIRSPMCCGSSWRMAPACSPPRRAFAAARHRRSAQAMEARRAAWARSRSRPTARPCSPIAIGATAQLAALRETSVLFGTALAMHFLGDKMNWRRWCAAGAIAAGAILLQVG
jgi:drug/metabolite transporter (DMT)-like permease